MKTRISSITALALAIAVAAMPSQSAQAGGGGATGGHKPEPVTNGGVSVGRG